MPENKSENAIIPDEKAVPKAAGAEAIQAENAWVEFERGRLSRRQALKKLGMTSAMAAFALFSVDDLARTVGRAMQRRVADNKVVEQIAQEFQQAGVALAAGPEFGPMVVGNCNNFQNGNNALCSNCNSDRQQYCQNTAKCSAASCAQAYNCGEAQCGNAVPTYSGLQNCWKLLCASCLANCN